MSAFKAIKAPSFLLFLPFALIGTLASYGWHSEMQNARLGQEQTFRAQLQQAEQQLINTLNVFAQQTSKPLLEQLQDPDYNVEALQRPPDSSSPVSLTVIYKDNRQIHPSLESTAVMPAQQLRLKKIDASLQSARAKLLTSPTSWQSTFDPHRQQHTALHCQTTHFNIVICQLFDGEQLQNRLREAVTLINQDNPGLKVTFETDDARRTFPHSLALQNPLSAYTLTLNENAVIPQSGITYLTGLIVIILPLLISWAYFTWSFQQQQRTQLKAASDRSNLSAHLSHELRTPLANLSLYTDLIERQTHNVEIQGYLNVIRSELNQLKQLTDSTIHAARTGESTLSKSAQSADTVIKDVLHRFQYLWDSSGCDIRFTANAAQLGHFDHSALESLLLQLLDNACKYACPGIVDIQTEWTNNHLTLQIRDYGPGVDSAELDIIFNDYTRTTATLDSPGFGVGLAAIRKTTERIGGSITAERSNPGLRFTARLPLLGAS